MSGWPLELLTNSLGLPFHVIPNQVFFVSGLVKLVKLRWFKKDTM